MELFRKNVIYTCAIKPAREMGDAGIVGMIPRSSAPASSLLFPGACRSTATSPEINLTKVSTVSPSSWGSDTSGFSWSCAPWSNLLSRGLAPASWSCWPNTRWPSPLMILQPAISAAPWKEDVKDLRTYVGLSWYHILAQGAALRWYVPPWRGRRGMG